MFGSTVLFNIPSRKSGDKFIEISSLEIPNNEMNKFVLQSEDIINVYSDPRDQVPGSISISGAVLFPGNYPIMSKNEKVTDIIKRAGGILPGSYPLASTFIRSNNAVRLSFEEILDNPYSKENFKVINGDVIQIQFKPNIVQVRGEVQNPGMFKYYKNY